MSEVITVRVDFKLDSEEVEEKVTSTLTKILTLERSLSRLLSLVRRMTDDDNLNRALTVMIRAIAVANQLRLAMTLAWAASGPWGLLYAATAGVSAGLMMSDFSTEVSSR